MRYLLLISLVSFIGCTSTPTLSPIADAGCQIETAVSSGIGTAVASALNCSNASAVQASLQAAFGNANLCAQQAAVSAAQAQAKAQGIKPQGVVGNLACPVAVSAALGYLTNAVPSSWGCSSGTTMSAVSTAVIAACQSAIPF